MEDQHHVVIVGGGFAGLNAARSLRRAPVRVTLIDRRNHHLFQPLLYQVATGGLSPADISTPIRALLQGQKNARVILGDVEEVDVGGRRSRWPTVSRSATTLWSSHRVPVTATSEETSGRMTLRRSRPSRTLSRSGAGFLSPSRRPSASPIRKSGASG